MKTSTNFGKGIRGARSLKNLARKPETNAYYKDYHA